MLRFIRIGLGVWACVFCTAASAQAADSEPQPAPGQEVKGDVEAGAAVDVEFTPFADISVQLRVGESRLAAGGVERRRELMVYSGEAGVDAQRGRAAARLSVTLDDAENKLDLHEAWGEWHAADGSWLLRGGRAALPLGLRDTVFPSASAAADLVASAATALGGAATTDKLTFQAWAFRPQLATASGNPSAADGYCFNAAYLDTCPDSPDYSLFSAGFSSDIGAADIRLAGEGQLARRTGGGNLLGELVWGCGAHRAVAEYSWTFNAFDPADLDADGDGRGDRPRALNLEYIHRSPAGYEYGARYEHTCQFADYAQHRYCLLCGRQLDELLSLRAELSHGRFDGFSTAGLKRNTQLALELRVAF